MRALKKRGVKVKKVKIPVAGAEISALILSPEKPKKDAVGLLWLHGGGYFLGMKEMAYMSSAAELTEKYGTVVVCPGYRLSIRNPYPAAAEDCYSALLYLKKNASVLGVAEDKIAVGERKRRRRTLRRRSYNGKRPRRGFRRLSAAALSYA